MATKRREFETVDDVPEYEVHYVYKTEVAELVQGFLLNAEDAAVQSHNIDLKARLDMQMLEFARAGDAIAVAESLVFAIVRERVDIELDPDGNGFKCTSRVIWPTLIVRDLPNPLRRTP
jgi:hypothetical protein